MKNIFWAALHLVPKIGSETLRKLHNYFGDGEITWNASISDLEKSKCLNPKALSELIEFRQSFSLQDLELKLNKHSVKICTENDIEYPALLKNIFNPPFIFYYQGNLQNDKPLLAVVGSRIPTAYGAQVAERISQDLAKAGFVIVSGAAKGIDTKAHIGALKTGSTIAVLGSGLDVAYPAENKQLLERICQNGAVISEYPLGTAPRAGHFPARNRIISGMTKGIIVVEAAKKSGSLITAELALSEDRDVFAVPGSIYSAKSQGCHKLIQQGAKLITNAGDIIEEYPLINTLKKDTLSKSNKKDEQVQISLDSIEIETDKIVISKEELKIYNLLSVEEQAAKSTDEIIYKLRENVSNIAFILLQMKIKGLIEEISPNLYIRTTRECVIE